MRINDALWILCFSLPPSAAARFGDALSEDALSVTVLAPPRQDAAQVEAIFDSEPSATEISVKLSLLAAAAGIPDPPFSIAPVPKLDWLKKVCEDFPPLKIARWTVHGALHRKNAPNRLRRLQIDATNAFGTGEHPTTRGCLLMLDKILKSGFPVNRMLDIGCGSGILSMACVQETRAQAIAVDLDRASVQIAKANATINGLASNMRIGLSNGYSSPLVRQTAPYDLIMSNIFAGPLCQMAKDLRANLKYGGIALLSGILTPQAGSVIAAHRMQGLTLIDHMTLGEWSVLALTRPKRA